MPFVSDKQRRYFHWKSKTNPTWRKRTKEWEAHTPPGKLPEKVASPMHLVRVKMAAFGDELRRLRAS